MSKSKLLIAGGIATLALLIGTKAFAAPITSLSPMSLWHVVQNYLVPNSPNWGLQIPSLTSGCVQSDASGKLSSTGVNCGTGGGGTDTNWTFFNTSGIRPATTTNTVLIGASATTTSALLEVYGGIFASASSTIGGGGSQSGLTIAGNSTTTGTANFNVSPQIVAYPIATSTVVCKQSSACKYTTIQGAINDNWTYITVRPGVYSEQLTIANSKTVIKGEGQATILQCNGVTATCIDGNGKSQLRIQDMTLRELNAANVGIAIDLSNSANSVLDNVRVSNFATSTYFHDTSNNTFYNTIENSAFFATGACYDFSGTLANDNQVVNSRCQPIAYGHPSFGAYVEDAQAITFSGDNFEGTTTGNIVGIYVDPQSRAISFINPYIEQNSTSFDIQNGALNTTITGGQIVTAPIGGYKQTSGAYATTTIFLGMQNNGSALTDLANATSTNFFATTASSTNLFGSQMNIHNNALVVDSDGMVGVGISNPSKLFEIIGNTNSDGTQLRIADNNTNSTSKNARIVSYAYSTSDQPYLLIGSQSTSAFNKLFFGGIQGASAVSAATEIDFATAGSVGTNGGTTRLTITKDGNVGIGNTAPSYLLDVAGYINTDQYSGYKQNGNTILYASTTNHSLAIGSASAAAWMQATSTSFGTTIIGDSAGGYTPLSGAATFNTGIGYNALRSITTGARNSAVGYNSLGITTTGSSNVANGTSVMVLNTTGSFNSVTGDQALNKNVSGSNNTINGYTAAYYVTGSNNTALGTGALDSVSGFGDINNNTFVGYFSGRMAQTGADSNTGVGYQSGYNISTGQYNTTLGYFTTTGGITTGSNNILIGQDVRYGLDGTQSNQLNIGNTLFGTGLGSGNTLSGGNIGIGTSSPYSALSVAGQAVVGNLIATSTGTKLGDLTLSGITGSTQCLHVDSSGVVSGTASDCGSGSGGAAYPFQGTGNSTSTPLMILASTTIGASTQTTGLTIDGGATTTGNMVLGKSAYLQVRASGLTNNDKLFSILNSGGNERMSIGYASTDVGLDISNRSGIPLYFFRENGFFGIGNSNPSSALNVQGEASAQYFTATSTLTATTLKQLLVTASSTFSATSTFLGNVGYGWASSTAATNYTVNWQSGVNQRYVLTGNSTIAINATSSSPADGAHYTLKVCQDPTGSRTLTFSTPGQLRWWNGTTTISSTANSCTFIAMIYDAKYSIYSVVASSTGVNIGF